eukprot:m.187446 g.187446  ORF g.187446 m.187446 type:complete len:144 (+) comp21624_c2_seq1:3760-4191(+)
MVPGEDVEEEALPPVLPAHPRLSSVLHPGAVFIAVSCSADGGVVAAGSDNTALVWDGRTGGQRHAFRYADRVLCLQVSSQGHLLATGCYDKKLSLHSLLLLQGLCACWRAMPAASCRSALPPTTFSWSAAAAATWRVRSRCGS